LLANILLNVAFVVGLRSPPVMIVIFLCAMVIVVFTILSVFLLAKEVTNIGIAILCAILMFIPCISLLILLVINQRATSYLQGHGIKVGFMGVNPDTI